MSLLAPRNSRILWTSQKKCNPILGHNPFHSRRLNVCIGVSAPGAPQAAESSPPQQPAGGEGDAVSVTTDEARRRNEEAIARVLSDFANAKLAGKLADAEEEDEDEVEGEEGEDWVWWRAENQITERSSSASSPSTSSPSASPAPSSPAAASLRQANDAGVRTRPSPGPVPAPRQPARAPPLASPFTTAWLDAAGTGGRPPTVSQFRRKGGPSLRTTPPTPPPPAPPTHDADSH
ncbi:hypothetical protein PLESTF_001062800 [Pleodorina starrii]|nr:hypothetical protein PLESTF_001062800 [Pleodorina starrii]